MALKKYRFNVTVGVHDPATDRPAVTNDSGTHTVPARRGTKYIAPGEIVEMEQAEGDAIIKRHGAYVDHSIPNPTVTVVKAPTEPK